MVTSFQPATLGKRSQVSPIPAADPYVTEIWGWDEKDQRAIHSRDFKLGRVQIVTANGVDVGRLDVDYGDEEIFLLLIELLPNHRGQGLGSRLIRIVLDRAAAEGKPLVLNVLEVN